jgi:hypothetical protein
VAEPWWIDRVSHLLVGEALSGLALGSLWNLAERLHFVRDNVDPALLLLDLSAVTGARDAWTAFEAREGAVNEALRGAAGAEAAALRAGARPPSTFHRHWEGLGFVPNIEGAATPADDYLDALFQVSRLTLGEELPPFGLPNLSSRAERISDFLRVFQPGPNDVVYDLGSGSGKVALTVGASCESRVRGVELGASYVEAARASGESLGLSHVEFLHADVRDTDLSDGTHFYLFYPFRDDVARATAQVLGELAQEKAIQIYVFGPRNGFREHFDTQVERGALRLLGHRGEFLEVMTLVSAHGHTFPGELS